MRINVSDIITVPLLIGLAVVLFLAAGLANEAKATVIDLAAVRDATIYQQGLQGDAFANGAGDSLIVGKTVANSIRRSLIGFDVSAIPAGSTITAVTLSLFLEQAFQTNAHTVSLHRTLADWAEGLSDANGPGANEGQGVAAVAGDVTFFSSKKGTSLWTTLGGDFAAGASASQSVGGIQLLPYTWTSDIMESDVQGWVDVPTSNFGWFIIGNEASAFSAKRFASRQDDSGVIGPLPNLHIEFDPPPSNNAVPEPSTILLLGSGLLGFGLLSRRRRKAD